MRLAEKRVMKRQAKGAAIAFGFIAAFVTSIALHSMVAALCVLFGAITVAFVVSIAWMRTSTHRIRAKQQSRPGLP